jgi:hypothetical protein
MKVAKRNVPMLEALLAEQGNKALAAKLQLYGQFVGSWHLDVNIQTSDGSRGHTEGEVHFDWVLEGMAIQDVWIFPSRRLRADGKPAEPWSRYGSTFRWYDPNIDAWHIAWFDPRRSVELRQIGRAVGADIMQIGEDESGFLRRWRFTDITNQSFRWLGEISRDKGSTWTLELEMRARRAL